MLTEDISAAAYGSIFVAWTYGLVATAVLGVLLPGTLSVTIDAVAFARRRGDWRPLGAFLLLSVVFAFVGSWSLTRVVAHGAPPPAMWLALDVVLFVLVLIVSVAFALERVVRRWVGIRQAWKRLEPEPEAAVAELERLARRSRPHARQDLHWREAEFLAAEWMEFYGLEDVVVTPHRRDGGLDVRSRRHVAQVKHIEGGQITVDQMREFDAVARAERRSGLYFTTGRYSDAALDWARRNDIATFVIRYRERRLIAANIHAQSFLRLGASRDLARR